MRYRALDAAGDYVFGRSAALFLVNTPETVAQAVHTRLALWSGEWFLDSNEGTPYLTQVLGTNTRGAYDQAIQERILGTPGVMSIDDYTSSLSQDRVLSISVTIATLYGSTTLTQDL